MNESGITRLAAALASRYRIERELGQGGMATVYLAEDLKHDRKVALKVLKPELAAVLGADRFVQEIKTTAALSHPHILPLFDSGAARLSHPERSEGPPDFLYYVMPFIDGETLRSRLDREKQLGVGEAVKITTEVADALDYAHRNGVIHRDIKPENILLHDGRPMVADFGIALAVSAAAGGRMTETGLSLGTPHYMSPEQATADKQITARSDVYSLASVLYEMLTGDPPHTGSSAQQIIMKIVTDQARPVTELRKTVPPNVAAAVAKALEKLPADRFESARAFADALANPHFMTTQTAVLSGGRGGIRWLQAGLGALVGVVIGAAGWSMLSGGLAPAARLERQQLTFEGLALSPAISPDGSQVAYVRQTCEHPLVVNRCQGSLVVQETGGTRSTVLLSDAIEIGTPHWTADGSTVVVVAWLSAERSGLFSIPLLTGTPRLIGPVGEVDTHPAADSVVVLSPAAPGSSMGRIFSLRTGVVADSFPVPIDGVQAVSWSPDGRRFAIVGEGTPLSLVDRRGTITGSYAGGVRQVVRWSLDGRSILTFHVGTAREDEFVRIGVDRDGRLARDAEVLLPRVPTLYAGQFDIARHTGTVAIVTGDATGDIYSLNLTSQPASVRRVTHGTTWYGNPTTTFDGTGIYFLRGDAEGDNVYHLDLATGLEEALTAQHFPGSSSARLSADGRRLLYQHYSDSGYQVSVMELPSRRERSAVVPSIGTSIVEPVGTAGLLALESREGGLVMADSLGGAWRPVPLPDSMVAVDYSAAPDGRRAVVVATSPDGYRLLLVSLTGAGTRVLLSLPADDPRPGVSWAVGDTAYVARWLAADGAPSLWRLFPSNGVFAWVTTLPAPCRPLSVSVGFSGRMAACQVRDYRSDIWLYRVPGVTR